MVKTPLLHPGILAALAGAGHGSRVLIADGNYPFATGCLPGTRIEYLNLRPGVVSVPEVLETVLWVIPVESAMVMVPPQGPEPEIHGLIRKILPGDATLQKKDRMSFYEEVRSPDTALLIATGEQRVWANVLLVIGVVLPGIHAAPVVSPPRGK
jgi:L-fucose mutarotase